MLRIIDAANSVHIVTVIVARMDVVCLLVTDR
jgi:hypothetical protein